MSSTSSPYSRRILGPMLLAAGLALAAAAAAQGSGAEIRARLYPSPLLALEEVRVFVGDGPPHLVEGFRRAVGMWAEAVEGHNRVEALTCPVRYALRLCNACPPPLPKPIISDRDPDVFVVFREDMPRPDAVALTRFTVVGGRPAAVIEVWAGILEQRALQVAVHEIARLYGIDFPKVVRTPSGAVAAGSDTTDLHPSIHDFMEGGPDPIKPTSADLYAATLARQMLQTGTWRDTITIPKGFTLRSHDEPDLRQTHKPHNLTSNTHIIRLGKASLPYPYSLIQAFGQ